MKHLTKMTVFMITLILFICGCNLIGTSGRSKYNSGTGNLSNNLDCSIQTELEAGDSCDKSHCCASGLTCTNDVCTAESATPCSTNYWSTSGNEPGCNSCSTVSHSTGNSATNKKSCICQTGYTWSSGTCTPISVPGMVANPTFSPAPTTYTSAKSVTISSSTTGANIRYTTTEPSVTCSTGTAYSTPLNISSTTTIRAIACKQSMSDSSVVMATYTINSNPGATPIFNPASSTITPSTQISITATGSTIICYRLDGSSPTCTASSCTSPYTTKYTAPFLVTNGATVKARACNSSGTPSAEAVAQYFFSISCGYGMGHIGEPCCENYMCLEGECGSWGGVQSCDNW